MQVSKTTERNSDSEAADVSDSEEDVEGGGVETQMGTLQTCQKKI